MLKISRDLAQIFAADLILRWSYQMGKSPVLPLFAAAIGAAEMMTGLIVAVSTFTGMLFKPLFGMLSDRWGRRVWLLFSLTVFCAMPFLYRFVETPDQLLALRLVHGLATSILGPVSLSYVAELDRDNRATNLAIFGMSRSMASLAAPICAAFALLYIDIETVFTLIGFTSLLAAIPLINLNEPKQNSAMSRATIKAQVADALCSSLQSQAVWLAGLLELMVYLATYAIRAFLPLFILAQENGTILQAGLFFTVQEAAHIAMRPIGGRLADRRGYGFAIVLGLAVLTLGVGVLPWLAGSLLLLSAGLLGAGQAMIFPASVAFLAQATKEGHRGAGMGFYGALRNVGKVAGPVLSGILLTYFSFLAVFTGFAVVMAAAAIIGAGQLSHRRIRRESQLVSGQD